MNSPWADTGYRVQHLTEHREAAKPGDKPCERRLEGIFGQPAVDGSAQGREPPLILHPAFRVDGVRRVHVAHDSVIKDVATDPEVL